MDRMIRGTGDARQRRALRGVLATAISTLTAATAHTLAGGGAPPWWMLVTVTALAAPLAVALVGRRMSLPGIAASVVVAQGALHLAFATIGTAAPRAAAGHHHTGSPVLAAGGHLHLDAGMIAAHLTAALATIALLVGAERLIAAIARGIRRLFARADAVLPFASRRRAPAARRVIRTASPVFLTGLRRRGPPAFAR